MLNLVQITIDYLEKARTAALIISIVLINKTLIGQLNFEYNGSIPVIRSGITLENAWAGGLDYIQISSFDYDFDGDEDLFIFDRSSNNIRVFLQDWSTGSPKWKYEHRAKNAFPSGLLYRATMIDYDRDGKKDLFTYGLGGLKVYRNTGNVTTGLEWTLFKEVVNSDYYGFVTNLLVSQSDIPAIEDIDFDGDIDVLTFHQGGSHVEYHKNMSMENYGIPDSLEFALMNECWGGFAENVANNSIILNDPNSPCVDGNITNPEKSVTRHAGSTLLALDIDNSGVMDLIIGDASHENCNLLINGGSAPNTNSAMISADPFFPSNSTPINLYLFPAPFFLDVDFDGIKDLIIGANAKNISQNEKSIHFYKNTLDNSTPNFIFQNNAFLQNEMIEHGKGSIPVIADVDGDGLKDLLISNLYRFKNENSKESTIAWYKNTGTASTPVYTFIDYDFLNLSNQSYGLRLVPTFGDINGDGKIDLFIGNEFGTLVYYEGTGSNFIDPIQNFEDVDGNIIDVGQYSHPQLFDLDGDNLLDLVIGNKDGSMYYYKNVGTSISPSFQLYNYFLGNIDVAPGLPDGYCAPHFFKKDGQIHLFVGNNQGTLMYYSDIESNLEQWSAFELVNPNFLTLNVEAFSSFFVEDIDGDGFQDMFVGQDLGGLHHYEIDPLSSANTKELYEQSDMRIYPNPFTKIITIESNENFKTYSIMHLDGKIIKENSFSGSSSIDLSFLKAGVYLIKFHDENSKNIVRRIIKID